MANPRRGERAWRRVHRAADANTERVRRVVLRAFLVGQIAVSEEQLLDVLATQDEREGMRLLEPALHRASEYLTVYLPKTLLTTLIAGANAAVDGRGLVVAAQAPAITMIEAIMSFDTTNPMAQQWASRRSSVLVVDIADSTRRALRNILGKAFRIGWPPRVAARHIRRQIGLLDSQVQSINGLLDKLMDPDKAGKIVRGAGLRVRVPKAGMTFQRINAITRRATDLLLRRRALNIARTETMAASNEGQRQLWLQAVQRGFLGPTMGREWVVTPDDRLCSQCRPLDGKVVGLNETFKSEGVEVMGPPLHPQCRCAVTLTSRPLSLGAVA